MQILATVLFFIVFIQLFVVLSLYLWKTLYDYFKSNKTRKREKLTSEIEQPGNVKLHISEGLIQVNRLPEEEEGA